MTSAKPPTIRIQSPPMLTARAAAAFSLSLRAIAPDSRSRSFGRSFQCSPRRSAMKSNGRVRRSATWSGWTRKPGSSETGPSSASGSLPSGSSARSSAGNGGTSKRGGGAVLSRPAGAGAPPPVGAPAGCTRGDRGPPPSVDGAGGPLELGAGAAFGLRPIRASRAARSSGERAAHCERPSSRIFSRVSSLVALRPVGPVGPSVVARACLLIAAAVAWPAPWHGRRNGRGSGCTSRRIASVRRSAGRWRARPPLAAPVSGGCTDQPSGRLVKRDAAPSRVAAIPIGPTAGPLPGSAAGPVPESSGP
jgi:hypothetical protein